MANYYVKEQGAVIHKKGERLIVTKDNKIIAEIPMHQLDQLTIMGNVQISTQSCAALLSAQVDVVFATQHLKIRGRLIANDNKYGELRVKQLQAATQPDTMLMLTKQIVTGKLTNQHALLQGSSGARSASPPRLPSGGERALRQAMAGIPQMMLAAQRAADPDSVRGYEGKAAAFYWPAFRQLLKRDMGFTGRAYHPPPDPLNALLSFCYALLQKDVSAAVSMVGLDVHIGFFHTLQYGRPSLVLDLMEEFRPIFGDALVLELVNQDVLLERDFTRAAAVETPDGDAKSTGSAISLREPALRRVIERYEQRKQTEVRDPITGQQTTLQRLIELQTRQLARVLKGEADLYVPYLVTE